MAETPEEGELRIAAADAGYERRVRQLSESVQSRFRYHAISLPDGSVLPGLQSVEHLRWRLDLFGLPEDLRGKRVLDIGAWDGWFSFECERRGASVVAVDCLELDTFLEARELLGSKVEYVTLDVPELSARQLGKFDIVLFLGVLYHLRHPLLGLEKVVELSTDMALIESFVIEKEKRAVPSVMEFYERGELGGQVDNWCGPSPECLMAMCRSAGFAQTELRDITNQRASLVCRRKWPEAKGATSPPYLNSATNHRDYTARFHPAKEEYVCCYFKSTETALDADSVFIEVDGYGVPALSVTSQAPGAWQANGLRPPGLDAGPHRVSIRARESARSNAVEIFLLDEDGGMPRRNVLADTPREAPDLCSAEWQASGDRRIRINRAGTLICYFRSPATELGADQVWVECGGAMLRAHSISSLEPGVWQINVMLDQPLSLGTSMRLRIGEGEWSNARDLRG
jgi:tRNA (mo5U34)-methyltransferase